MNWECLSIISNCIIAIMAIAAFVYNAVCSSKKIEKLQSDFTKLQTDFAAGQAEISIRNMISTARNNYLSALKDLSIGDDSLKQKISEASLEDWLNSYDEACAKYLDGKIDKDRFKKMYFSEIRQIVEDENTKSYYDGASTRYWATRKVYDEWNNPEK